MEIHLDTEEKIYQRIGEFVVSFQWIENKLREICWFLDPKSSEWPPKSLRNLNNKKLVDKIHKLFNKALKQCKLPVDLENDFKESMDSCVKTLHQLRKDRNKILHSAFIELKAGGEVQCLMRSNLRLQKDKETGEMLFDQEYLTPDSFDKEMNAMAEVAIFLNRVYKQLVHRYSK